MKTPIDCIAYDAFVDDDLLTRVSNAEYLGFLKQHFWEEFTDEHKIVAEKILSHERYRYISVDRNVRYLHETFEERYGNYKKRLVNVSKSLVGRLFERVNIPGDAVKLVITTTNVQGVCPALSSTIAQQLGLGGSVQTIDLCFMGCASSLRAVELAANLLEPGDLALVVSVELTSAMLDLGGDIQNLVASCVFGDGAGAFLLAVPKHKYDAEFRFVDIRGHLMTDNAGLRCIRYEAGPSFHQVRLDESISEVAGIGIRSTLEGLVRRNLVTSLDKIRFKFLKHDPDWIRKVDYFTLHPAGNKILLNIKAALHLSNKQSDHNFSAFKKFGNTSSSGIFYSLKELDNVGKIKHGDTSLFLAYGSGFMTMGAVVRHM